MKLGRFLLIIFIVSALAIAIVTLLSFIPVQGDSSSHFFYVPPPCYSCYHSNSQPEEESHPVIEEP